MDLDTFLTRLYVLIDDWYKGEMKELMQRHAGAELQMSDSEVLTLVGAGGLRYEEAAAVCDCRVGKV